MIVKLKAVLIIISFIALSASGFVGSKHVAAAQWHTEVVDTDLVMHGSSTGISSLAVDSSGNPHIAYYDQNHNVIKYASLRNGQWHIETVWGPVDLYIPISPSFLAIDKSDNPHISFEKYFRDLVYVSSQNGKWGAPVVAAGDINTHPGTPLALDSSGNPHICYAGYKMEAGPLDLKYRHLPERAVAQ